MREKKFLGKNNFSGKICQRNQNSVMNSSAKTSATTRSPKEKLQDNNNKAKKGTDSEEEENNTEDDDDTKITASDVPATVSGEYTKDKPYLNLPPEMEARLRLGMPKLFSCIKFFESWEKVDAAPSVMPYVFEELGLEKNQETHKTARARLWMCLCRFVFKEVAKLRSKKIATFHNVVKHKYKF